MHPDAGRLDQNVAVELGLVGGFLKEGEVGGCDGRVGEEGRDHVDEVGPELGDILAVGDGAVGPPGHVVDEVLFLSERGVPVAGVGLADEERGDAFGGGVAGCTWSGS